MTCLLSDQKPDSPSETNRVSLIHFWPCLLGDSIQQPICLEIASNALWVWRLGSIRLTPTSNISSKSQAVTCVPGCLTINQSSHNPLGFSWFASMASPISGQHFLLITGFYTQEIIKDPEEGMPRVANRKYCAAARSTLDASPSGYLHLFG